MRIRETLLPFALPDTDETEIEAVAEAIRSGWITTGPKTRQFESEFAAAVGAKTEGMVRFYLEGCRPLEKQQ